MSPFRFVRLVLRAVPVTFLASRSWDVNAKRFLVDDSDTNQINYSPNGWDAGNICIGHHPPALTKAYNGTWHKCVYQYQIKLLLSYT
jgi:hypothetical protein